MDERVIEALQRAKERLAERGWVREPELYHSGPTCVGLALGTEVDAPYETLCQAVLIFQRAVGTSDHVEWNDHVCQSEAQALDAFDAAIRLAKDTPA